MNQSEDFLRALSSVWNRQTPPEVLARVRQSLIDYISVTCAGAKFQEKRLRQYDAFAQPEAGKFKALGTGKSFVMKESVFLNALNSHALDYDDGTNIGIIHLGAPIFSLIIPLAQQYRLTVGQLLRAAVIGYEASFTLAASIQPWHKELGYHATGTCGTPGAALAAGYLLGFCEEELLRVFSAACVSASGTLKVIDNGGELKPYNVAKASLLALTSLQLAKAGFRGDLDPLGGRGFLKMMTERESVRLKPVLLNGTYAIQKTYTKPYASCRYTHPAIEAAIQLRNKVSLRSVKGITVRTYSLAVSGHDGTNIERSYSAKMSIPYATAVGLLYGKAGLQEFSETILHDAKVRHLTGMVRVIADESLTAAFPEQQSAILTVHTSHGDNSARVDFPKGEPGNPLTEEEFKDRYDELMEYAGIQPSVSAQIYNTASQENALADSLVRDL